MTWAHQQILNRLRHITTSVVQAIAAKAQRQVEGDFASMRFLKLFYLGDADV